MPLVWDTPAGPSIVVVAMLLFLAVYAVPLRLRAAQRAFKAVENYLP